MSNTRALEGGQGKGPPHTHVAEVTVTKPHLNGRCINIKFPEDSKSFFIQLIANCNVCNIRGIVVVQAVDVFHHTCTICFNSCQDQEILEVPLKTITLSEKQ